MTPTPDELAEWSRLADAATHGPWVAVCPRINIRIMAGDLFVMESGKDGGIVRQEADAAFIAASRSALPRLLARVKELEADRDRMKAVLIGYEKWEADLVVLNPWLGAGGLPTLTEADYDRLLELQAQRNAAERGYID